jgi:chromosome partitioning protein
MGFTITVAQRKGGVGKTTIAVSVAAELQRRGTSIALIDSDPQQSSLRWAGIGTLSFPVYEIALIDQAVTNWVRAVITVARDYDCVVIDTAPSERVLGASIAISNLVLVPCTPSGLDLDATIRTLEIVDAVRPRSRGQPRLILVPNRVDSRTLEGRQLVDELAAFGEVVSGTIGNRSAFVRAFSLGRSVADIPDATTAHVEIQQLCDLITRQLS